MEEGAETVLIEEAKMLIFLSGSEVSFFLLFGFEGVISVQLKAQKYFSFSLRVVLFRWLGLVKVFWFAIGISRASEWKGGALHFLTVFYYFLHFCELFPILLVS